MNLSAVRAIVRKDFTAFLRDRFYLFMTVLGIVFYVGIFWFLPSTVERNHRNGRGPNRHGRLLRRAGGRRRVGINTFASAADLEAAIRDGDGPAVGLAFPDDFASQVAAGNETAVTLFVTAEVPAEVRGGLSSMVREMAYLAAGNAPLVMFPSEDEVLLGVDRAGDQVSLQETMRPLFVFFLC